MKYGPLVTNPGVREWSVAASIFATLYAQSDNRFEVGLGRGDSSRRMLGKKPMTIANMVKFTHAIKGMVRGDKVEYDGTEANFPGQMAMKCLFTLLLMARKHSKQPEKQVMDW